MEVPHSELRCAWPCTETWLSYVSVALPCEWTLGFLHASELPDTVLNTGCLARQSAAWHRIEHWLSCMSVSCLAPYWTLALLYVGQLPDTVLNTGCLACQSAAWHRTEHWLSCMSVSCL